MVLKDASALVTGAGRGIGRATALALGRAGAAITLVARTRRELETVAEEVRQLGGKARVYAGDLCDGDFCRSAAEAAAQVHGRLQILVNNAAIGVQAPFVETSDKDWDRTIGTNLSAVFRITRAALPQLTAGGGHILMISSLAGRNPIANMSAYCASKAALDQLAACLMLEVRHQGVKVTTIAPGSVDTTFGAGPSADADWMLQANDVAATILALLETRDDAHLSRIEMRPLRPPKRA